MTLQYTLKKRERETDHWKEKKVKQIALPKLGLAKSVEGLNSAKGGPSPE